jgi:hypothetical protein
MMLKWQLQQIRILLSVAMLSTPLLCHAQSLSLKNNAIYDVLLIPNLGMEAKIGARTTIEAEGTYDPISFPNKRKWKNWSLNTDIRHWGCKTFSGFFVGVNAIAGGFNVSRIPIFNLDEKRAQCHLFYGGGLTLGNHFVISPHWGLETKIDLDFVHLEYSRYRCGTCGYKEEDIVTNYAGPTSLALSLIYIIK